VVKRSAGLLLYRRTTEGTLQVLIVHMGGPLWARKDVGAWSIPKGEYADDEDPLSAARREFREELGLPVPGEDFTSLGSVRQAGGKPVCAWAVEADLDVAAISSNTFTLEWPPRSGRLQEFPEVDRAAWVDLATAREKLVRAQVEFLDRLEQMAATTN
jgi:predicted NUDIX family NTP pyrophosphohydrolase